MTKPAFGDPDYQTYAVLFNDVSRAPKSRHVLFSVRNEIADYLWEQGWRRDVRDSDYTDHPPP